MTVQTVDAEAEKSTFLQQFDQILLFSEHLRKPSNKKPDITPTLLSNNFRQIILKKSL